MAKSIPAMVTPEVLKWARELDGISVEEIAAKMKIAPEKILSWECGSSLPTLRQAKDLARKYRIPFVYFFLPDIPKKEKRLDKTDYRTLGNIGRGPGVSRELSWFLRDIEDRRDAMISLYEQEGREPVRFPLKMDCDAGDDVIAEAVRKLLELTDEVQFNFRKPERALSHCMQALEKSDVLVFQSAKVQLSEMRGLSAAYEKMPIIALNRKDEASARLFTLCHELVHIVTRTSGICVETSETDNSRHETEMKCNRIAGSVLVPMDRLSSHPVVSEIKAHGFTDARIRRISADFAVSREVILHRLWEMNVITKNEYFNTLKRYSADYQTRKEEREDGYIPHYLNIGTQLGKLYARTVLNAYYTDEISVRDASGYLMNLKLNSFEKLEGWCF